MIIAKHTFRIGMPGSSFRLLLIGACLIAVGTTTLRAQSTNTPAEYFGEIVVNPPAAYVGQVTKLNLRFFFRADIQFDNLQRPSLLADKVVNGPVGEPVQSEIRVNNIPYNLVTFETFVVPAIPGRVVIDCVMEGIMRANDSSGKPSGLDPFFDQFFKNLPDQNRAQNVAVKASGVLPVTELPKESQPANFHGVVGQFTIAAKCAPEFLKVGESARLSVTVNGAGNFLAIDAAALLDPAFWKLQSAELSTGTNNSHPILSGTKTLTILAQAIQPTAARAAVSLAFFNPAAREYQHVKAATVSILPSGN